MYRIASFILLVSALAWPDSIRAQAFEPAAWIVEAEDAFNNFGLDADAAGFVYMSGRLQHDNEVHWSDGTIFLPEHNQMFLARIGANGNVHWVRPGVLSVRESTTSIHTVVTHSPYVWTNEGAPRGSSIPTRRWSNVAGILINRYSEDGDSLLATYLAGPVNDIFDAPGYIEGIGVDGAGNIYAAGVFIDTLQLGPSHVVVPREVGAGIVSQYVFLASYTREGQMRWAHRMAGSGKGAEDRINYKNPSKPAFGVDAQGNTYIGGFFRSGSVFGEGQPDSVRIEESDALVVSYNAAGQLRWLRTASDLGVEANYLSFFPFRRYLAPFNMGVPWTVTVNDNGELALGWTVPYSLHGIQVAVGDTIFSKPGRRAGGGLHFVTKYSPDGSLRWARQLIASVDMELTEMAMDMYGHVYVGGYYWGDRVQIEDTVLASGAAPDFKARSGFLVHYNAEGKLTRTLQVTGPEDSRITGIVPTPNGELYVAGFAINERGRTGADHSGRGYAQNASR